ncbi:MAG: hypothetical protein H7281_15205 [Bacteriovorax sp.]|nr:hypothetical protein [Bacteriovorax sp.]
MECECKRTHLNFEGTKICDIKDADADFDGAWFSKCNNCQSIWITILYEAPHYSDSTHWYKALLAENFDYEKFLGSRTEVNSVFETTRIAFFKGITRGSKPEKFSGVPKRVV